MDMPLTSFVFSSVCNHIQEGDKILLPPSAFDILARLQVDYPMLFQLQSPDKGTLTTLVSLNSPPRRDRASCRFG